MPSGKDRHAASTPRQPATVGSVLESRFSDALSALTSLAENAQNLRRLIEQLKSGVGVVPFVGAGMSVPFGFPAWRPFLESQAPDAAVQQCIVRLLDQGQYEEAAETLLETRGEHAFQAALEDTFGARRLPEPLPPAAILQLPRLCFGPVLTTNLDSVLEKVFENARRPFDDRILGMKVEALREAFHRNRRVLVKLHGDAADPNSRVLTRSDYERAYGDREPLKAVLRFAMQVRPLLFLGCSLGNDRTVRVLEALAGELRRQKAEDLLEHYAIVEQPRDDAEFAARHERLERRGIFPIWYPTGQHRMIAELLAYLAAKAGRDVVCGAVPAEPPHYLLREVELAELRGRLLAGGTLAITGQGHALGVQGMGGVGKTVLAAALTRVAEVQRDYPDGIFWLTVSAKPDLLGLLNQLAGWLPDCGGPLTSETHAQAKLREALSGKRALLVLDDVWDLDHAAALNIVSAPGRLLVTTRKREVLVGLNADEFRVEVLTPEGALRLLANWAGEQDPARLPSVAADVARECGFLPLALAMIGAMVRLWSKAWVDALVLLQSRDLDEFRKAFPDYPYPDLLRAIAVGVDDLPKEDRKRYLDLAAFPEDEAIPEGPLQVLWDLSPAKTRACMDRLVTRSLATRQEQGDRGTLRLHDLQWDYVRKVREKTLVTLHEKLLRGYARMCEGGRQGAGTKSQRPEIRSGTQWALGPNDGYYFQWLPWHLRQAGREDELRALLWIPRWYGTKVKSTDVHGLLRDLAMIPQDRELRLVHDAVSLSAHALARDETQIASQLVGRLLSCEEPHIQLLVQQITKTQTGLWLRPLKPTLTPPGGPLLRTLEGHSHYVEAVAVTGDGKVVSGSADNTLKVWDLASGQLIRTLREHWASVNAVTVTGDGKVVSASGDRTLKVWDLASGTLIRTLEGHAGEVEAVAATSDGKVVSGARDNTIKVWDIASGKLIHTLEGHSNWVYAVAVTGDGKVVSGARDSTIKVWDIASGKLLHTLEGHDGQVFAVAVTADGKVVSGAWDKTVKVWDIASGQLLHTLEGHTNLVVAVAVTADGKVVSGAWDKTLKVWDIASGKLIRTLEGHSEAVHAVAVTADGEVVSGSADDTLKVWDLASGKLIRPLEGHSSWVCAVAVTAGGKAVSAAADMTLKVWDLASCRLLHTLRGHSNLIRAVAVTADGKAVSGSWDKTLKMYDLVSGQLLRTIEAPSAVHAVAVTADGKVVSGLDDHTLKIWDLASGELIRTLEGHSEGVYAVAVTADGKVVSGSWDRTLKVWDLASGQHLRTIEDPSAVHAVAVTADGKVVSGVYSSGDNTISVRDLTSGQLICTLEGHTEEVEAVAVTGDGKVVSASEDKTLKVWDLASGKLLASFVGEGAMNACAIAPDRRTIVGGDAGGHVHFLRLEGV